MKEHLFGLLDQTNDPAEREALNFALGLLIEREAAARIAAAPPVPLGPRD